VKFLIDECLHTSLLEVAHAADHVAHHVNYLGLGGSKDWELMATIRAQDYLFVTNNRSDFLAPGRRRPSPWIASPDSGTQARGSGDAVNAFR